MKITEKNLDWLSVAYMAGIALVTILLIVLTTKPSEHEEAAASTWTAAEESLIEEAWTLREMGTYAIMRVLTVADTLDLKVLRATSADLTAADLSSPLYARLAALMVATVTSPEQDGVGIAGPQVGINRRVVAVQRFDKEGYPFEVYPNIRIDSLYGERVVGPEGCLSVPGLRGNVQRWSDLIISYTDTLSMQTVRDTVSGFTAVIFQHETDHLDGILYTDRTDDVTPI